jgi:2-polyprenyl-6-methoxyphenol hydroxylase-like FAD-dependent oxidoreductase
MTGLCGEHAIVIGAGIGGLAAAAALARFFKQVTVLERDELGMEPSPRPGAPQSRQVHGLLVGGLQTLCELFPGFDRDLADAGAVPIRVAGDVRYEMPGYDPFPQRDFGWTSYAMTRPLLEHVMRERVRREPNVRLLDNCRVLDLTAGDQGAVAVRYAAADAPAKSLTADLVIDASGRGAPTLSMLRAMDAPPPEHTEIGIDLVYATAIFEGAKPAADWKIVITSPDDPSQGKTSHLFPVEGGRWMALIGERHVPLPPDDIPGFLNMARQLRTSTLYDFVKDATPVGRVHQFRFPENSRWHYEKLDTFPRGLLPLGDAICRFNPIYGQGMTVALQEARILQDLLQSRVGSDDPLESLAQYFFAAIHPLIEGTWAMSAIPDFANPATRGQPPKDIGDSLRFSGALIRLAARDAKVHELVNAVRSLVRPASALRDPDLVRRIENEMAESG